MTPHYRLAGRFKRLLATLIDMLLVPALSFVFVMAFDVMEDAEDYLNVTTMVLSVLGLAVLSYLLLNGYTLLKSGQTLGKRLLGIAIVPNQPNAESLTSATPAPWWKLICIRALFFPLLFLTPLVFLPGLLPVGLAPLIDQLLIFTKRRRCLHDLLAGTVVIDLKQA